MKQNFNDQFFPGIGRKSNMCVNFFMLRALRGKPINFQPLILIILILLQCDLNGCKKLIEVPPPIGTVISTQVFSNDAEATAAVNGLYYNMINTYLSYSSGATTIYCGMSADEFNLFDQTNQFYFQFQQNKLLSTNGVINGQIWNIAFSTIYSANAILEGLSTTTKVHTTLKNELIGEVKFSRAFANFYLTNLFGDIPLVTSTNWRNTSSLPRIPQTDIYKSIVNDLLDAQSRLPSDYAEQNGQRTVPNKWAATALLSRVYLYLGKENYSDAYIQANSIIQNSTLFTLTGLNQVFLSNSGESIWQLEQSNNGFTYNAVPEAYAMIPFQLNSGFQPLVYLTNQLLNSFEPGDMRRIDWVDSTAYNSKEYYFPYKYKVGPGQATPLGVDTEYYSVFRLGEQYLIRAEAQANGGGNGIAGAISDLNIIRNRAGLPNYTGSQDAGAVLNAIYHENQIEFFAEWGHRWLDLKRWGLASQTLTKNKGYSVTNSELLYPIPNYELRTDPNLTQNQGY